MSRLSDCLPRKRHFYRLNVSSDLQRDVCGAIGYFAFRRGEQTSIGGDGTTSSALGKII